MRTWRLYRDQGDYGRAEEFCRRALGLISEPAAAPAATRAQVLGTLGGILDRRGKLAESETLLLQSAEIAESLPAPSLILAGDLNNLAGVYAKTGRAEEALATYRKAYELNEKAGGPNDPNLFYILAGMASVEAGAGHFAKAVEAIKSGIRKAEAGGAANTLQVRDALVAEAAWLHKLKREEEARRVRAREKQVAEAAARNGYLQYTVDARQIAQTIEKPQR